MRRLTSNAIDIRSAIVANSTVEASKWAALIESYLRSYLRTRIGFECVARSVQLLAGQIWTRMNLNELSFYHIGKLNGFVEFTRIASEGRSWA